MDKVNGYAIEPGANLRDANLRGAVLRCANLWDADLRGANLGDADLRCADLRCANLRDADLRGANLGGANLGEADLRGANLGGAKLPHFQICPEEGSFTAFKKVSGTVIRLLIPANARRTSSLVGRKCRAEFVVVDESSDFVGYTVKDGVWFVYCGREVIRPDKYDDDIRVECTHGIHFFMTRKEAEEW